MIGEAKLTEREKKMLKKCIIAQSLSEEEEFIIGEIQASWRFFLTGFDYDDMIERYKTTEEGKEILKEGYYVVISI